MAACIAHDGEPGGSDREHDAVATVLIIGASGGIGLETVKAALEAGHSVRALARSARRIRLDHPKLEKIDGENDDDYDVLADGVVVGRIMRALAAPVGTAWMWTLGIESWGKEPCRA
jgi:NAD(P)-dependent dehydrogenase (short-subunit alcohol dehydrogenase family)